MPEHARLTASLPDEAATETLGRALAAALAGCRRDGMLLLRGELGAGKSTLARAILRGLGHRGAAPSPTYTLVEPYDLEDGPVYHVDLYRIGEEAEVEYLGWADLDDGLRIVEWPERAPSLTAGADLCVTLRYAGEGREAELRALGPRGRAVLRALQAGGLA